MYIYSGLSKESIDYCKSIGMHPEIIEKYAQYVLKKIRTEERGMKSWKDSDKTKVYKSELAMAKQVQIKKFKDIVAARKRMDQIQNSKLWKDLDGPEVRVKCNMRMGRGTAGRAYHGGTIELSGRTGLDEYTLVHEMCHQLPKCMHHGVQFRINLLKLVSRFIGAETAKILKAEFKERKLKLNIPQPRSPESWFKSYQHMENVRNGN